MWWLLAIPLAVFLRYQRTHERGWFPPPTGTTSPSRPDRRAMREPITSGGAGKVREEVREGEREDELAAEPADPAMRFAVSRARDRGQSFSGLDRVSQPMANMRQSVRGSVPRPKPLLTPQQAVFGPGGGPGTQVQGGTLFYGRQGVWLVSPTGQMTKIAAAGR